MHVIDECFSLWCCPVYELYLCPIVVLMQYPMHPKCNKDWSRYNSRLVRSRACLRRTCWRWRRWCPSTGPLFDDGYAYMNNVTCMGTKKVPTLFKFTWSNICLIPINWKELFSMRNRFQATVQYCILCGKKLGCGGLPSFDCSRKNKLPTFCANFLFLLSLANGMLM